MRVPIAGPRERLICANCRQELSENSSHSEDGAIDEIWCERCTDYVPVRIVPDAAQTGGSVDLSRNERDMAALAQAIVAQVISSNTTHAPDAWLRRDQMDKHLDKALRHVCTARLIRDGHEQNHEGVEGHLRNAVTRLMMALLCQRVS